MVYAFGQKKGNQRVHRNPILISKYAKLVMTLLSEALKPLTAVLRPFATTNGDPLDALVDETIDEVIGADALIRSLGGDFVMQVSRDANPDLPASTFVRVRLWNFPSVLFGYFYPCFQALLCLGQSVVAVVPDG